MLAMYTHLAHIAPMMSSRTATCAPAARKAAASSSTRALGEPSSSPTSTSNVGASARMVPSSSSSVATRSVPPTTAGLKRAVRRSTWTIPLRNGTIMAGGVTAGAMSSMTWLRTPDSDFTASTIAS